MGEFISIFIQPLVRFFCYLYRADDRPEARSFTVGCMFVTLAIAFFIAFMFHFFG
jgi:hypothetical protein